MSNGSIKWDSFWDVQQFFTLNGKVVDGTWIPPELAKTDDQFEEILTREIAREKINDPSVSFSEVISELDLAMVFFNDVLIRASFENINEQAYKEMRRIVSRFTNFIKSKNSNPIDDAEGLPGKNKEDQIIPAAPTYIWGLNEAEIEKILETIIPADRESARLLFSGQKPVGKVCMVKPYLIFTVGRLIAEKRIKISNVDAIDFLHKHFTKKDGNSYSKESLKRYFQDADLEKMGPLQAIFFGDR